MYKKAYNTYMRISVQASLNNKSQRNVLNISKLLHSNLCAFF